jgi:hypothetical protein
MNLNNFDFDIYKQRNQERMERVSLGKKKLEKYGILSSVHPPDDEKFKSNINKGITIKNCKDTGDKIKCLQELCEDEYDHHSVNLLKNISGFTLNYINSSSSENYSDPESDDDNDEKTRELSEGGETLHNMKHLNNIINLVDGGKGWHTEFGKENKKLKEKYDIDWDNDYLFDVGDILYDIENIPISEIHKCVVNLENIWRYFSEKSSLMDTLYDKYTRIMYNLVN